MQQLDIGDGEYYGEVDDDGHMHGQGTVTWASGATYQGEWRKDEMHGCGKYTWEDGDTYEGQYKDGMQHGIGEHREATGVYQGAWEYDERHGHGIMKQLDGTIYDGQWYHNERHGQGRQLEANGELYEGDFYHGVRQGRGVLTTTRGDIYDGDFVDGKPNGEGTYRWTDGTTFKGSFLNGEKHGQGCERFPDGSWVAGTWKNGEHDGLQPVHKVNQREVEVAEEENIAKLSLNTLVSASPTSTVGSPSGTVGVKHPSTIVSSSPAPTTSAATTIPAVATPATQSTPSPVQQAVTTTAPAPSAPPVETTPHHDTFMKVSESELEGWIMLKMLGKGSFGAVHEVALLSGKTVCVKVIELGSITDGTELNKLRSEIALMKRLHHVHIVQYYGCLEDKAKKTINIFMELVTGGTLNSFVKKFKTIPIPTIRNWTRQMISGVKYLHDCGIVHRDIKGDNVLVSNEGVLKLADFGCSKSIDDVCSKTHGCQTMVGTPYWMAPEVIKCDAGGYGMKSDIWSIGCTVVEMITGKPPWPECNSMWAAVYKIANSTGLPTEIPKDLDPQLMNFLEQCFERDPSKRSSAGDLLLHPFIAQP